jgi:plastocyanin
VRRQGIIAAAVALGACALVAPAAGSSSKTVRIHDVDFTPHTITVKRGDRVRWVFDDADTQHNVTSRGRPRFTSSATKSSGAHTVRFTRAGTYRYVCTLHFNMKAKVVVR